MATFKNASYLRVVPTKSYSAIGGAISGVPTGPSIGRILPSVGMLTNLGMITQIVINGASSGAICALGTGGSSNQGQGKFYQYTDKLCIYSGDAAVFGFLPAVGSGYTLGHANIATILKNTVQNRQVGYFATGANVPTSFSLPKPSE